MLDRWLGELHADVAAHVVTAPPQFLDRELGLAFCLLVHRRSTNLLVLVDQPRRTCNRKLVRARTFLQRCLLTFERHIQEEDTLEEGNNLFHRRMFGLAKIQEQNSSLHAPVFPASYS